MRTCISIALAVALWFGINERYAGAVSYWDQPQNTTDGAGTEFCSPGVLSANCVMESESDGSVACVPSVVAHTILGFDGMTLVWITSPAGQSYGGSGIAGFVTNDYGQIISATAETFVTPTTTIGFGGDVIGSGPVVGPVNLVLSPKGAIAGQVMTFDGSFWNPATPISGSVTAVTGSGGVSVASPSPTPNVTLANFDCSSGDFVSSANTVSGLACTTPFYQTWIDASLTPLPQEPFSEAGVGLDISDDSGNSATKIALPAVGTAGSCTNCSVTFDGFGRETARSSGTAPVTSVTGNDGLTCSPSAPNPTCSGVGVYVSGTATPSSVDLGALASGVNEQTVSAGVATPVVFASGSTRIPFGSGANGQFTDSANLTYSSGTETITGTSPLVVGNGATGTKTAVRDPDNVASFAQIDFYPASGTNVGQAYSVIPRGTGFSSTNKSQFNVFNTDAIADPVNTEWFGGRSIGTAGFVFASGHAGTGSARPIMFASDWFATGTTNANQLLLNTDGTVTLESLGAGGIVKAKASSSPAGQLAIAAPGTDYQAPLTACTDYVSVGCQTGATDIGGTNATTTVTAVESDALARGAIKLTAISAPAAPGAGTGRLYEDSGSLNVAFKNASGTINHGIQNFTCGSGPQQFVKQVSSDGSSTCAQAAFSDISGTSTCAQSAGPFTGDVTKSAGSCATTVKAITETSGPTSLTIGAIPDSNPAATLTVRPAGASTLVGLDERTVLGTFPPASYLFYVDKANITPAIVAYISPAWNGTGTWNEFPVQNTYRKADISINFLTNTGTGTSVDLKLYHNGVAAITNTYNNGVTGYHTSGATSVAIAPGDTIGVVIDGTNATSITWQAAITVDLIP